MTQQRNSQSLSSNARAALVGFALSILLASLSQAAWQRTNFSCTTIKLALGTLSFIGLAVWQTIHTYPCAQWIFDGFQHLSVAFWPLFVQLAPAL